MKKDKLVTAVFVAILAAAVIYSAVSVRPRPKWLLSGQVIPTLTVWGTADNLKVSGVWRFTLAVNTYDQIDLLMAPPEVSLSDRQYIQSVTDQTQMVPLDMAKLRERRALRLTLTPLEDKPVLVGRMLERKYVYDDGTGTTRAWRFWEFDSWKYFFLPYKVRVSLIENGVEVKVLVADKVIFAGPPEYGGDMSFSIPEYGIKINNLGALLSGRFPPSDDMALIYVSPTEAKWVKKTDLKSYLQRYFELGKTPIGKVQFKLTSANQGEIKDSGKSFHHQWEISPTWLTGQWITTDMTITDGFDGLTGTPRIYIKEDQGSTFGSTTYNWEFQITATSPGFKPDEFRFKSAPGWLQPSDWRKIKGGYFDVSFSAADPRSGSFDLEFRGAADTYKEVAEQTGAAFLTRILESDIPEWHTAAPSWLSVSDVWDKHSLYSDYCENAPGEPTGITTANFYTAVAETPVSFATQLVTVEAPLDLFDAYVYIPPWGIPKIQKIEPETLELAGGQSKDVTVTVKNEAPMSGDTFYIQWSKPLPFPIYCESIKSATVGPGETKDITITLSVGSVGEKDDGKTVELPFAVVAAYSGKYDNGKITGKLKKGFGIAREVASVDIFVIDKKTHDPVVGAFVTCAGSSQFTGSDGKASFSGVTVGTQTATAEKEGYYKSSTTVEVSASKTNIGYIYLVPKTERETSPLLIAAVVSAVAVGSGAAYYFYYKRKRP
jgi:hypothetical protein